jgi:peptidoglycan biosynthesis protein MviN/MurJ (putative lipid II flippase)
VADPGTSPLRRRALYFAAISATARIPGFLIPLLIGAAYGAGSETDAYFLAYGAVFLTGGTLAQGIESAIVHFSASARNADGFEDGAARKIGLIALLLWILVVPVVAIASPARLELPVLRFALLLTPLAVLWPVCAAYSGGLIARWQIGSASGSMLWRGAGALAGVLAAVAGGGLMMVAVGLGLGELVRLLWFRGKINRTQAPGRGSSTPVIPGFAAAASAQVLAGATGSTAPFVERFLATSLGSGGVSMLEYAARLLVVPAVLFEGGFAPLLLARWSNDLAEGRTPSRREVGRIVGKAMLLAAAIAGAFAILAPPAVQLLLGQSRLSPADMAAVSGLLRLLAIGFVATMGALLLERLYLAHARNRRLAFLAIMRAAVRLGVVILVLPSMGLRGFAIGYGVAEWAYLLALVAYVPRVRQSEAG